MESGTSSLGGAWRGQLTQEVVGGGKRLTVVVQPFLKRSSGLLRIAAIAVEAPDTAETLGEIFASHAHADIGEFDTVTETLVAAEAFIQAWLVQHPLLDACACRPLSLDELRQIASTIDTAKPT